MRFEVAEVDAEVVVDGTFGIVGRELRIARERAYALLVADTGAPRHILEGVADADNGEHKEVGTVLYRGLLVLFECKLEFACHSGEFRVEWLGFWEVSDFVKELTGGVAGVDESLDLVLGCRVAGRFGVLDNLLRRLRRSLGELCFELGDAAVAFLDSLLLRVGKCGGLGEPGIEGVVLRLGVGLGRGVLGWHWDIVGLVLEKR